MNLFGDTSCVVPVCRWRRSAHARSKVQNLFHAMATSHQIEEAWSMPGINVCWLPLQSPGDL